MNDIEMLGTQYSRESPGQRCIMVRTTLDFDQLDEARVQPPFQFAPSLKYADGGIESHRIETIAEIDDTIFQSTRLQAEDNVKNLYALV